MNIEYVIQIEEVEVEQLSWIYSVSQLYTGFIEYKVVPLDAHLATLVYKSYEYPMLSTLVNYILCRIQYINTLESTLRNSAGVLYNIKYFLFNLKRNIKMKLKALKDFKIYITFKSM